MQLVVTGYRRLGQPNREQTERIQRKDHHIFSCVVSPCASPIVTAYMRCAYWRYSYSHPRALPSHPGFGTFILSSAVVSCLYGAGVAFLVEDRFDLLALVWLLLYGTLIVAVCRGAFLIVGWNWKHDISRTFLILLDGSGSASRRCSCRSAFSFICLWGF